MERRHPPAHDAAHRLRELPAVHELAAGLGGSHALAVMAARQAIEDTRSGGKLPMVLDARSAPNITGPAAIDGIGPTDDWQGYWQKTDLSKRKAASWANGG